MMYKTFLNSHYSLSLTCRSQRCRGPAEPQRQKLKRRSNQSSRQPRRSSPQRRPNHPRPPHRRNLHHICHSRTQTLTRPNSDQRTRLTANNRNPEFGFPASTSGQTESCRAGHPGSMGPPSPCQPLFSGTPQSQHLQSNSSSLRTTPT